MPDQPSKPKSYVVHIQWNAKENYYAGFIPGIEGTETTAYSREELMTELQRKLAKRLREGALTQPAAARPRTGFRRVDLIV